jgi:tetratricopeptide (TPR) repeat protein
VSLIIGALKRAQQLRLQEIKRVPFFQDIQAGQKKKLKGWAYAWMAFALGLAALLTVFFLGGRPSSPLPQAHEARQRLVHSEPEPSLPAQEPSGQDLSNEPPFPALSKEVTLQGKTVTQRVEGSLLKTAVKEEKAPKINHPDGKQEPLGSVGSLSIPRKEENFPPPPRKEEKEGSRPLPPANPPPAEDSPRAFATEQKADSSVSPSPSKEESPQPSWVIKNEGENEAARASDVLNHFNRGVHFTNQRETSKAIQAYQKTLELDPKYVEAYNNLGILYQETGDWENARKAYRMALDVNPDYEKALNNLGILYYRQGKYEESLDFFQRALAVNPQNVEGHINLGVLFKKRGRLDQAMESFQRALALNPYRGEIHYNLGLVYEQAQKNRLAVEHYQAFIHLSAKTHPALVRDVRQHVNRLRGAEKESKP